VRSPHAHARIASINTDAARSHPGVLAVVTSSDLEGLGMIPCAMQMPDLKVPPHPALAKGHVRYVGEPVAAVVAEDAYTARDAAEMVAVEYEPLPVVLDMERALEKDSALIYQDFGTNKAFTHAMKSGDIAAAYKKADRVVKIRLLNQRVAPTAMEPRSIVAEYLPGENRLTIWASTQIPHLLKTQVAIMVGLPETAVRVIAPEVGGGFGSKLNVYAEDGVVPWLSIKLGRPVKWTETRRESLLVTIHGRDTINYLEMPLKKDGTILGLRARILADMGAYHQLLTPLIPQLTALMLPGCYKIPAFDCEIVGVFTNKMSTDAYRGAGRPEAA
jgi:carbon-monoxide dehydrogenase large subunit